VRQAFKKAILIVIGQNGIEMTKVLDSLESSQKYQCWVRKTEKRAEGAIFY
jgi:hypothetical protein